jgi:hypothetical protein
MCTCNNQSEPAKIPYLSIERVKEKQPPIADKVLHDLGNAIEALRKEIDVLTEKLQPIMISPQPCNISSDEKCDTNEYASYFQTVRARSLDIYHLRNAIEDLNSRIQL